MNFKNIDYKYWLIAGFVLVYGLYVFYIDISIEAYAELIAAIVFFFALFSGFFISRQNDRFSAIDEAVSKENALFSYLYRVSGLIPAIQDEVREVVMEHYQKIKKNRNWAYHTENASTTITDITNAFAKIDDEENIEKAEKPAMGTAAEVIWDVVMELQLVRKRIVVLKNQKLLFFQWGLIYLLGILLIFCFNFIPNIEGKFYVDLLKILFGTTVFMVIILLKQLNDLTLFGKEYSEKGADDVLWIIEEKDKEMKNILPDDLKERIEKAKRKVEENLGDDISIEKEKSKL